MGLYRRYGTKDKYKEKVRNVMIGAVLIFLAVVTLFPIYYMVISSFGAPTEAGGASYSLIPRSFSLASYEFFFDYSRYSFRWIMNSLLVAGVVTVSNVVFASLAGYAFAKLRFPGCRFFFFLLLVAMMIPYQVTQVPLYILVVNVLKWQDTYTALVAPTLVTCYNVFLAKQFFTSLPTSVIESAKIEGCSQPLIVWKIVMPLSKTILAVMAIMTFLGEWNTFFWPFLVCNSEKMQTIQVGLKNFSFANTTYFAPMMAGATVSALPMFILFFSLQRYFLEGVTVGAVKG
ncbi:MAG: carbohydrate ABC transporter permease [Lachnospiraceae bacterium]|jgi:multiple sugar transport system permease protein|nr:carbohydrate ABC transporter permease [Lachnospiraceae bacterium]MCI9013284.1 carbohydrate ABC transporter permease [Lachnospiraceae bacterium]MCI9253971.1 carbohydrate ABC transporter permease [Lachnospiraceae bacterium]